MGGAPPRVISATWLPTCAAHCWDACGGIRDDGVGGAAPHELRRHCNVLSLVGIYCGGRETPEMPHTATGPMPREKSTTLERPPEAQEAAKPGLPRSFRSLHFMVASVPSVREIHPTRSLNERICCCRHPVLRLGSCTVCRRVPAKHCHSLCRRHGLRRFEGQQSFFKDSNTSPRPACCAGDAADRCAQLLGHLHPKPLCAAHRAISLEEISRHRELV